MTEALDALALACMHAMLISLSVLFQVAADYSAHHAQPVSGGRFRGNIYFSHAPHLWLSMGESISRVSRVANRAEREPDSNEYP